LNLSLEKRFSHNWQGGINYTLSRVEGNYGGLASSDEAGRVSPNVERYFDYWFMPYQLTEQSLAGLCLTTEPTTSRPMVLMCSPSV